MSEGEGCSASEPYALQVTDNSMEPEFPDKCIIIIDPVNQCRDGQYVFAENGDQRWFRQYVERDDGRYLVALNDIYPEMPVMDNAFKVLGVIVQRNVNRKVKHYPV